MIASFSVGDLHCAHAGLYIAELRPIGAVKARDGDVDQGVGVFARKVCGGRFGVVCSIVGASGGSRGVVLWRETGVGGVFRFFYF